MRQKPLADRKGFTLVEVIVVLAMLVVLSLSTYAGVKNLVKKAEQDALNLTARSLFMAAQSALTHTFTNDPTAATELCNLSEPVTLGEISPQPDGNEEWNLEQAVNADNIVSLHMDFGADGVLRDLLNSYMDDAIPMGGSVLIEFNKLTGNVLSCFFCEDATLRHGGDYDVYNRGKSSLTAAGVGFYGVYFTGTQPKRWVGTEADFDITNMDVMLVDYGDQTSEVKGNNINGGKNYGLLALEMALPKDAPADLIYTIDLTNSAGGTYTFTVGGANADIPLSAVEQNRSLPAAFNNPVSFASGGVTRQATMYIEPVADALGRRLMILVLDAPIAGKGIGELYAEIADGNLNATFTAQTADLAESCDKPSNIEHALYAAEDSGVYAVSSARHFHNVRKKAAAQYMQKNDLAMLGYDGARLDFAPIAGTFTGTYNGDNFRISDLTVSANVAAPFERVSGTVSHVYMADCAMAGVTRAAGIVAENAGGTVSHCTVTGDIHAQNGSIVGGVAATSTGTVSMCAVAANVTAGAEGNASGNAIAGGVVGSMTAGTVEYCEVATATIAESWEQALGYDTCFIGTPYFGAVNSSDWVYKPIGSDNKYYYDNNRYRTRAFGADSCAGGIVGEAEGSLTVSYCVNASWVGAEANNGTAAGGIVGRLENTGLIFESVSGRCVVQNCYNAGAVFAPGNAGGIAGYMSRSTVQRCYNTGYVNFYAQQVVGTDYYTALDENNIPRATVTSNHSGGVVGYLYIGRVRYCYNMQYVGGYETAHNGLVGLAGTDNFSILTDCSYLGNKFNTDGDYRYTNLLGGPVNEKNDGLTKRTIRTMRNSPIDGFVSFTGSEILSGVGPFVYRFPYLSVSNPQCALGANFHRTPWLQTLVNGSEGSHNLAATAAGGKEITFDVAAGDIEYLRITVVKGGASTDWRSDNIAWDHSNGRVTFTDEKNAANTHSLKVSIEPHSAYPYDYRVTIEYAPLYKGNAELTIRLYDAVTEARWSSVQVSG